MTKLACFLLFLATFLFYKFSFAESCKIMVHNSQISTYNREVTVVIGTDRMGSKSSAIAAEIVSQLALDASVKINLIDLAKLPKSVFKSDYFAKKTKAFMADFVEPIQRANGIIFVVPEYDGAVPGILSYYMNHMRISLDKKQVALVGISAGKWGARSALDSFKGTLTHRRARVLGDLQVNIEQIDAKFEGNKLTHQDSKNRLADTVKEIAKSLNQAADAVPAQKVLALLAAGLKDKNLELKLNNSNSVEGKFTNFVLNKNGTLAYVQFSGPTKIKNKGEVIPGQDVDVHNLGYGMPVGEVKNFKKAWYKKENLEALNLTTGKRVKLEYESGVIVTGKVKRLSLDAEGNLLVITFTDVVVNNKADVLFQKEWGDFDIAVADYIEQFVTTDL